MIRSVFEHKWLDTLEKFKMPRNDMRIVIGEVCLAILKDEEPDFDSVPEGLRRDVDYCYTQATSMKEDYQKKLDNAGNRSGTSKYNAEFIFVLRKYGKLSAPKIKEVLGYPNDSAVKDSKGWAAANKDPNNEAYLYEKKSIEAWQQMLVEIEELKRKLADFGVEIDEERLGGAAVEIEEIEDSSEDSTVDNEEISEDSAEEIKLNNIDIKGGFKF